MVLFLDWFLAWRQHAISQSVLFWSFEAHWGVTHFLCVFGLSSSCDRLLENIWHFLLFFFVKMPEIPEKLQKVCQSLEAAQPLPACPLPTRRNQQYFVFVLVFQFTKMLYICSISVPVILFLIGFISTQIFMWMSRYHLTILQHAISFTSRRHETTFSFAITILKPWAEGFKNAGNYTAKNTGLHKITFFFSFKFSCTVSHDLHNKKIF